MKVNQPATPAQLLHQFIKAVNYGDLESIIEHGRIQILINLVPFITLPADPKPMVKLEGRTVTCLNLRMDCESTEVAEDVADALEFLISVAC